MTAGIIALFGLFFAVVSHVAALRAGLGALKAYAISLLAGVAVVNLAPLYYRGDGPFDWGIAIASLLLFGSWWFIFLNLVQATESSIRVRILSEVLAAGNSLNRATLSALYNDDLLVRIRLDRLMSIGAVTQKDGCLFVKSAQVYWLARFFRLLKIILIGRPSEFEVNSSSRKL